VAEKVVIAIVVLIVGIVLLPSINDMFSDTFIPLIANATGVSDFEMATWRFVPIFLLIFLFACVMVVLIKKSEDRNGD